MKEILQKKGIKTLYHFTRAENLDNIFKYGIVPRTILSEKNIDSFYNDDYRYDACMNAVCISIEFPNYKMFYKLRMDNPQSDWVVLKLSAKILCDFKCAYCWTNAGDANVYNIPLEEREDEKAFVDLFNNKLGYPEREMLQISDCYPTNPQAEVLVFGIIPVQYIQAVHFENSEVMNKYLKFTPNKISSINASVFGPREDWKLWKS